MTFRSNKKYVLPKRQSRTRDSECDIIRVSLLRGERESRDDLLCFITLWHSRSCQEMLAMTVGSNPRNGRAEPDPNMAQDEASSRLESRQRDHSGLSALIEAATSQLGHLNQDESPNRGRVHNFRSLSTQDDGVSSDGGEGLDRPALTPPMVPEADPSKQSFSELLMTLAGDPLNANVITFLPDGKFFAIRSKDFYEGLMLRYFAVTTFEEFLEQLHDCGFSRILQDPNETGIEVFRHPKFIRGDWGRCSRIKFGESPTEVRVSALPERARIEYTMSDAEGSAANIKRRLSPGFIARRESESSVSSQKLKVEGKGPGHRRESVESETTEESVTTSVAISKADELRSLALAITTEKLNLKQDVPSTVKDTSETPLVDRAVKSATHTIVTDAIESLLRDESHSKKTYLKHEKELSKSSLPGVIPISRQLFSPREGVSLKRSPPSEVAPIKPPEAASIGSFLANKDEQRQDGSPDPIR